MQAFPSLYLSIYVSVYIQTHILRIHTHTLSLSLSRSLSFLRTHTEKCTNLFFKKKRELTGVITKPISKKCGRSACKRERTRGGWRSVGGWSGPEEGRSAARSRSSRCWVGRRPRIRAQRQASTRGMRAHRCAQSPQRARAPPRRPYDLTRSSRRGHTGQESGRHTHTPHNAQVTYPIPCASKDPADVRCRCVLCSSTQAAIHT